MRRSIAILILSMLLLAWAPWITDEYATKKITEKLGGPDAYFYYLDKNMKVKDIPKTVGWLPFCRFVAFPGEAGWFVTFYGGVWLEPKERPLSPFYGTTPGGAGRAYVRSGFGLKPGVEINMDSVKVLRIKEEVGRAWVYLAVSTVELDTYEYVVMTEKQKDYWVTRVGSMPTQSNLNDSLTVDIFSVTTDDSEFTVVYGKANETVKSVSAAFGGIKFEDAAQNGAYIIVSESDKPLDYVMAFDENGKEIFEVEGFKIPGHSPPRPPYNIKIDPLNPERAEPVEQ